MAFNILNFAWRAADRIAAGLRTGAAREVAILGPGARLTNNGRVYNIRGPRDAITIGAHSIIAGYLQTSAHGGAIRIGDWVFVGPGSRVWSAAEIVIGNRTQISHNVEIHDNNSHPFDAVARFEQTKEIFKRGHPRDIAGISAAPIVIGDDVWIGFGATVHRGVRIGHRAIIGARAIVSHDVLDDGMVRATPDTFEGQRQKASGI